MHMRNVRLELTVHLVLPGAEQAVVFLPALRAADPIRLRAVPFVLLLFGILIGVEAWHAASRR